MIFDILNKKYDSTCNLLKQSGDCELNINDFIKANLNFDKNFIPYPMKNIFKHNSDIIETDRVFIDRTNFWGVGRYLIYKGRILKACPMMYEEETELEEKVKGEERA